MEDDKDNIIYTIIKLMEQTERFVDKNGEEKKVYVMEGVKIAIGDEMMERYYYFISMFIDFAVKVCFARLCFPANNNLNLNKIKKKYCCY
jgi:hypothetical protein